MFYLKDRKYIYHRKRLATIDDGEKDMLESKSLYTVGSQADSSESSNPVSSILPNNRIF